MQSWQMVQEGIQQSPDRLAPQPTSSTIAAETQPQRAAMPLQCWRGVWSAGMVVRHYRGGRCVPGYMPLMYGGRHGQCAMSALPESYFLLKLENDGFASHHQAPPWDDLWLAFNAVHSFVAWPPCPDSVRCAIVFIEIRQSVTSYNNWLQQNWPNPSAVPKN